MRQTAINTAFARSPRSKWAIFMTQPDGPGGFVHVESKLRGEIKKSYWILESQVPTFRAKYASEGMTEQDPAAMVKHVKPEVEEIEA